MIPQTEQAKVRHEMLPFSAHRQYESSSRICVTTGLSRRRGATFKQNKSIANSPPGGQWRKSLYRATRVDLIVVLLGIEK